MLMRDLPRALDLPEAYGYTHPGLGGLARGPRTPDSVEAVTERHLFTHHDAQVTCLILDGTLHPRKPCLKVLAIRLNPLVLEWGKDVERQDVGRVVRHQGIKVLGMQSLPPLLDELPELGFVIGCALLRSHSALLVELG